MGKTHCKIFNHHFCVNIRFFLVLLVRYFTTSDPNGGHVRNRSKKQFRGKIVMASYDILIPMFFSICPANLMLLTESKQFGSKSAHICATKGTHGNYA